MSEEKRKLLSEIEKTECDRVIHFMLVFLMSFNSK